MIKIGEDQDKAVTYENEPNVDRKLFPNIPLTVDIGPLEDEIDALDERLTSAEGSITTITEEMRTYNGQPVPVDLAADMTDENKIYVYLGDEAGYTAGDWYYYDGSEWVSGGAYAANPIQIDDTLTQAGEAADAKKVGDEITQIKSDFSDISEDTGNLIRLLSSAVTVKNVKFTPQKQQYLKISQTANDSGGRTTHIIQTLTLAAGTYTAKYEIVGGTTGIPDLYIENVSGNTIMYNMTAKGKVFTLESTTSIYIGANVTNNVTYDVTILLSLRAGSHADDNVYPADTAVDFITRKEVTGLSTHVAELDADLSYASFTTLKNILPFMVGAFTNDGDVSTNTKYRLISENEYTTPIELYLYMPSDYKFGVMTYSGSTKTDSGWLTGEYIIPAGSHFRVQLARATENGSEVISNIKTSDLYTHLTFCAVANNAYNTQPLSVTPIPVQNPWSQGACLVGRTLVGFNASSDDHSTPGTVRTYDVDNNLQQIASMGHNLGHSSTADYNQATDTMIVANGTYAAGVTPTIYLIKDATESISGNILTSDENVVGIDISALPGHGCGACFGEDDKIVYILTVEDASQADVYITKYLYKVLLGKGTNNLLESFESDSYGTYISGCEDNEYNGTIHVLKTYTFPMYGELQGMKFRNGFLLVSIDTSRITGTKTPYIAKIEVADDAKPVKLYQIPNTDGLGDLLASEPEGFVLDGTDGYIAVWTSGTGKILKFDSIF